MDELERKRRAPNINPIRCIRNIQTEISNAEVLLHHFIARLDKTDDFTFTVKQIMKIRWKIPSKMFSKFIRNITVTSDIFIALITFILVLHSCSVMYYSMAISLSSPTLVNSIVLL